MDPGPSSDPFPVNGPEKRRYVFAMFGRLAPDYDRCNRIISWGLDRRWRSRATALLVDRSRVCDLGTGTGEMSRALLAHRTFAGRVIALDPARELWAAESTGDLRACGRCRFAVGEGEHLPLAASSCDGIMSGFVMRNFFDLDLAMREAARVVAAGGRGVFLEMGHPRGRIWSALFRFYFGRLAPLAARRLARHPEAYRYLPASLARFPGQEEIRRRFLANGWRRAEYKEYLRGAVVVYRVSK